MIVLDARPTWDHIPKIFQTADYGTVVLWWYSFFASCVSPHYSCGDAAAHESDQTQAKSESDEVPPA